MEGFRAAFVIIVSLAVLGFAINTDCDFWWMVGIVCGFLVVWNAFRLTDWLLCKCGDKR